jgi:diguanylate cyclase (GGDEF)-like protein
LTQDTFDLAKGAMTDLKAATSMLQRSEPIFESYVQIAVGLLDCLKGACLLDSHLTVRSCSSGVSSAGISDWLARVFCNEKSISSPISMYEGDLWTTAVPLNQTDGELLGLFCVQQQLECDPAKSSRHAEEVAKRLKPLIDCIHRELVAAIPKQSKVQALTERTAELEWLFKITNTLKSSLDDRHILENLLAEATKHLNSAYGALAVPDKRLVVEYDAGSSKDSLLRIAWTQTQQHLLTWAHRQNRPLLINGTGHKGQNVPRCKILSVPMVRDTGRVIGVLAFFNPPESDNYGSRQTFLARHLGRQAASIVDTQFDLMTGLYTRGGLEQIYGGSLSKSADMDRSVIYVDVDHMHVVNELHGFELGNELIVRIADLMAPPTLPAGALSTRISADRFAIVIDNCSAEAALTIAERVQCIAAQIVIGPPSNPVHVSVSCGVAALVSMPQGLDRAIAAAEQACKLAKSRGRNRVELYACTDNSLMRRRDDVIAVGQLRSALKEDRLLLFAQRIVPLRNQDQAGGYEILLRLRSESGELVLPGPLITAAQRYQLLPSVDRWVTQRALQLLTPYRGMLESRGIGISINVSGQSMGDESFISQFEQQLKDARLPADCITVEITEQAAVTNLVRAREMIEQLKMRGCQFALDDFGTGSNSLTYLKNLQISRVKIDGSFIRDIAHNRNSRATVRAIVELASGFSIDTVAEYVESEQIAQEVRSLGVDYAQGYAFGKPEPLDQVLSSLAKDESKRLRRLFLEA